MLGPDSRLLTALLIIGSAGLLVGAIRFRLLPAKVLCGALSIMVAMTGGVAAVNYYYGYYTTWGQLAADLSGGAGNLGVISPTTSTATVTSGRIGWVSLPGRLSGYDRRGLVYLPPQYGQARYARVRFPVVELFHGTPGTPLSWDTVLRISQVANSLIARHETGPMVLVMPSINGPGHQYQDCVNGPSVNDDTYLTRDVRTDILARYRVSSDPYQWGVAGYSSGGFCAANLALRHPTSFGAAAVINGYFRAADGPAGLALHGSQPLEAANSPLYLAEKLAPDGGPLPAFWVAAGVNDRADYQPATMFAAALNRLQQVPFVKFNAGDTANAWSAALPSSLAWLWQQLAPPDLRVLFPVRSQGSSPASLYVPPVKHHPGPCKPAPRSGSRGLPCVLPATAQAGHAATAARALRTHQETSETYLLSRTRGAVTSGLWSCTQPRTSLRWASGSAMQAASARDRDQTRQANERLRAGASTDWQARRIRLMLDSLALPPLPTLHGDRVILRGPRDSDVDDRLRHPIDPEEEDGYGSAWRREWDGRLYHTREYLTAASATPDPRAYSWKVEYGGHCIGSAALDVNPDQHTAEYSVGLFVAALRGRGLGREVTRLVLAWAFDVLGVHRVELQALAGNSRAINCYLACGFRQEGIRREAELYPDGWKDFIMMGILRAEHTGQAGAPGTARVETSAAAPVAGSQPPSPPSSPQA